MAPRRRTYVRRRRRVAPRRRRRAPRRGRRRGRRLTGTKQQGVGVSRTQYVKLVYTRVETVSLTSTSPIKTIKVKGNGLYNPNVSGIFNNQPNYFDKWSAFYYTYYVGGSKIEATATDTSQFGQASPMRWVLIPTTNESLAVANATSISDMKGAQYRQRNHRVRLNAFRKTNSMFGHRTGSEEDYKATVSTDPINQWYWQLKSEYTGVEQIIDVYVKVTYYVKFSDPKPINDEAQSY